MTRPKIAITMGDPTGIGPEVIVGSWCARDFSQRIDRVVFGRPEVMRHAIDLLNAPLEVQAVTDIERLPQSPRVIPVVQCGRSAADDLPAGMIDARGGQAAYDAIVGASKLALRGAVDAVVTAPLNKAALAEAGHQVPGHTELLAELCRATNVAMMLYLPPGDNLKGDLGLGVVHVTLHTALLNVFTELSIDRIVNRCRLADRFVRSLLASKAVLREPKIGVAALNPHAGEQGLFGKEEIEMIGPAVEQAVAGGMSVCGPLACDTLMHRAANGEFDSIVAMYHDQGHIALKLLGLHRAVNVTLGLPIIRTSVAHGTAFDLAWQGKARPDSMINAISTAVELVEHRRIEGSVD